MKYNLQRATKASTANLRTCLARHRLKQHAVLQTWHVKFSRILHTIGYPASNFSTIICRHEGNISYNWNKVLFIKKDEIRERFIKKKTRVKTNCCIFTIHSLTSIYNFYTRPSFPRNNIIVSFRFFSLPSPPSKEGTRCSPPEAKQKEPIKPNPWDGGSCLPSPATPPSYHRPFICIS